MIVVDSSVLIEALRGRATPASARFRHDIDPYEVLIGDLVLLEVLQGAYDERHAKAIERELTRFELAAMLDPDIAIRAARNFRELRRKGVTVRKTVDLVIGTFCIERGHALLHQDRDFEPMARHLGLQFA
ncbi:PIN domain nuclease [Chelatococcus sambhunathii]|uniref:Ribonuclease VapC n=1 Tax=Chelatococcus sambhunathii TaxID=363953 RepID=A0ABU1DG80_9HYPH|nr:PIN domain nuclease [Chelatococcus sambhunathii]MDR4307104.1 PIN domain nuclease [Chelatococcus sambhunathii]